MLSTVLLAFSLTAGACDAFAAPDRPSRDTTAARDDLAALSDEFTSAASLGAWRRFDAAGGWPSMVRSLDVAADGTLRLRPWTSGWYADFHAPFLYKEVSGDFVVTSRLRADGYDGGVPRTPWSLAGLMVRAPRAVTPRSWTPGGENWLFVTTGVAEQGGVPLFETKTTVNSRSRLRLHPARAGWVELRITRTGATFVLAHRYDGGPWTVLDTFERPDMPATVQVGLNAYTDWYHAQSMHDDPLRFNTTVLTDGRPDMELRVDWVRFGRRGEGGGVDGRSSIVDRRS